MTPQEFAKQCELLAITQGMNSVEWIGKVSYPTYRYVSPSIKVVLQAGHLTVTGVGKREHEQAAQDYILLQRASGKISLSFGEMYLRWTECVAEGMRGAPSAYPVNLGCLGSLAPMTVQIEC